MEFSKVRRRTAATTASILALTACLAIADQAAAQQAPASQDGNEGAAVVDEIVVGTRASLQSAMNRKKRAGTISDSIVAEDISQFPDKNVGEALGRVTGVQLARDFGEGNAVSIRGVEPDLNRVEINGMSTLSSAGNLQVYGGGGRANDFRELASELVASIDVFKGFTADMTEGGVGGTVSVKTRKPLDFKKPTLSLTASAQNLDTVKDWKPRANLFAATRLFDGRLGLMANVTYDDVDTRGDYVRNTSWGRFADFDNATAKTVDYYSAVYNAQINALAKGVSTQSGCSTLTTPDATQISTSNLRTACLSQWYDYAPRTARYGVWTRGDKRLSAEFTAQFRFTDKIDGWISYNRFERKQRLNDINYGTDFTSTTRLRNAASATACSATDTTNGAVKVDANHNVTAYTLGNCLTTSGAGGYGGFGISARDFQDDTTANYYNFGANYRGDRLQIEFQGSKADTSNLKQTNNVSVSFDTPGMVTTLDPTTGNPSFAFATGYSPADASAIRQWQIQYRPSNSASKEDQYKLDFDFDTHLRFVPKVEFGGRLTDYSTKGYGYGGFILNAGANPYSTADDTVIYSNAVNSTATILASQTADQTNPLNASAATTTGYWATTETWSRAFSNALFGQAMTSLPSDFYFGGAGGLPSSWKYPDFTTVAAQLDTSHFNLNNLEQTTGSDGKAYGQFPYYMSEKTDAQYIKFNYEFPIGNYDVEGNFGWRRVHTESTGTGVSTRIQSFAATNGGTSTNYTLSNSLVTTKQSYTAWLPSFNAGVWLIPNKLTARAGFAQLLARPRLDFLMPTVSCTTDNSPDANGDFDEPSCTAGNPELKPYRANQYDLSFEYYPNKDTQVSVGLFKKDIKSFYLSNRTLLGKRDVYGDGVMYNFNTYINGDGAKIQGVEITAKTAFTFLPGFLSGFGVDANYTYQKAKDVELYSQLDGAALPFPGLSKDSANLTVWYDKGPFNARLAYNYRSKYLVAAADNSLQPVYRDSTGYLDGKVTWKPKQLFGVQNISFFVEGKNLTKEEERSTAGDIRLTELGYFGRRFFVGMGLKF